VLAGITVAMGQWIGYGAFFSLAIPVVSVAVTIGLWLFYLQHHYEGAYWSDGEDWSYEKAALEGSSYIAMPRVLEWFAGAINYHHIHHLVPKIPCYRLRAAHQQIPEFNRIKPLTWRQILGSWRLRLVDEDEMAWCDFPPTAASQEAAASLSGKDQ
jgi:omega-6 fatty acid desaturase (delta-12 desaturase)